MTGKIHRATVTAGGPALRRVDHGRRGPARGRGHPARPAGRRRRRHQRRPADHLRDRGRAGLRAGLHQRRRRPPRAPGRRRHPHRLRACCPTPRPAPTSRTSCSSTPRNRIVDGRRRPRPGPGRLDRAGTERRAARAGPCDGRSVTRLAHPARRARARLDRRGRRRRRRLRHRRADRRARAAHPRAAGAAGHQGRARLGVDRVGAGRHRRGARPRGLARRRTCRTRSSPAAGCATRARSRCWSPRARRGCASSSRAARCSTPTPDGEHLADPRGRAPRRPHRARGRRRHGRGDLPRARRADRGRARRPGHRGHRARARPRRAHGSARRRTARPGRACGVTLHVIGEGQRDGVGAALGRAVVLATGGIGQVYRSSTNPAQATGDGIAAALRAGARARRRRVRAVPPDGAVARLGREGPADARLRGRARRGRAAAGHRRRAVHAGRAPAGRARARGTSSRTRSCGGWRRRARTTCWLDARHLGADFLRRRFPTINERLLEHGIDLTTDLVPVAPAQHYHSGGVRHGPASAAPRLPGLYAVGEVACTGVHGANRLASNSLLEGLVFAHRAARRHRRPGRRRARCRRSSPVARPGDEALVAAASRARVQRIASDGPGRAARRATGLRRAAAALAAVPDGRAPAHATTAGGWRRRRWPSGRRPTCTRWPPC